MSDTEELRRKCMERLPHYMRLLNFDITQITQKLIDNDELWERAKTLPVIFNGWVDSQFNKELKERIESGELDELLARKE